jgi:hypothetical protein
MSNDWLRLWHDMPNDPKWRTIARVSGKPIPAVMAVYLHMLVCGSNARERGRTHGWCDEDVATALDLSTDDVIAIRDAMQGRVLESDYLKGWDKRQPKREDGGAERAKAWRDKKKDDEERKRTQVNAEKRPDTDTEEDTEKKDPVVDAARVTTIFGWLEKYFNSPSPLFTAPVAAWLSWGADFELDIKSVAERWRKANPKKVIRSLEWLDDDVAASIRKRTKPMPEQETTPKGDSYGNRDQKSKPNSVDKRLAALYRAGTGPGGEQPVEPEPGSGALLLQSAG